MQRELRTVTAALDDLQSTHEITKQSLERLRKRRGETDAAGEARTD